MLGVAARLLTAALACASAAWAAATPYVFEAVVVPLSVCAYPPSATQAMLDKTLFAEQQLSVRSMFLGCSLGGATFEREDVVVLPYAVPVCGVGVTDPRLACDFQQWAEVADQWLDQRSGLNLTRKRHRIYVLPRGISTCQWGGMGWVGCSKMASCKVWIAGELADRPMAYFHELGHNLGLGHANTHGIEYGDSSDAMGLCCTERCFNAPHLEQLGWALPAAELSTAAMPPNTWQSISLSASTAMQAPYLKVTAPYEAIFAQFRLQQAYDRGIPSTGVYMYAVAAGGSATTQYGWLVNVQQVFRAGSGLHIRLARDVGVYDLTAMLLLCLGMCT